MVGVEVGWSGVFSRKERKGRKEGGERFSRVEQVERVEGGGALGSSVAEQRTSLGSAADLPRICRSPLDRSTLCDPTQPLLNHDSTIHRVESKNDFDTTILHS